MNPDAVMEAVANRLGVNKADILDPTSSDAAIKQAHAETHVIQETKEYFRSHGVDLDAFKQSARDDRILLIKNFPFGVTGDGLALLLEPFGHLSRLLLPPHGTIAVAQFIEAGAAAQAIRHLMYRNMNGSPLYLEKGPMGLFDGQIPGQTIEPMSNSSTTHNLNGKFIPASVPDAGASTLFVRNLNFETTTTRLVEAFKPLPGFLSAKVKTKTDPRRPGQVLSTGYGFVEFAHPDQAQVALTSMNGYKLDQYALLVKTAKQGIDAGEERRRRDVAKKTGARRTKIIIKNLPFEASKKDVRALFGTYGQLRSVRVPKKFDRSTRGFAFADFLNVKEAENAIEALANTHLLGRRLVLEFASEDAIDPEDELQAIENRVGKQTDIIQMNKITGSARGKFTIAPNEDDQGV